jgi:hypothetical protein
MLGLLDRAAQLTNPNGHDLRADPPAHAARARNAPRIMMRHDRSTRRSEVQEQPEAPLYQCQAGG